MPEALGQVKRDLGPDAVILGTRSVAASGLGRLVGRDRVEITAAPPETHTPAPRVGSAAKRIRAMGGESCDFSQRSVELRGIPSTEHHPPALPEQVQPFFQQLVRNEVSADLARRLLQAAVRAMPGKCLDDRRVVAEVLRRSIARMVPTMESTELLAGNTRCVALVGPSGAGKTTTLAKLAAHMKVRQGRRVGLLSLDMHRLAAHEQLRRYAEIIGVSATGAHTVAEVKAAVEEYRPMNCLLIDTPGIGMRESERISLLDSLLRAACPDEVHLVLSATTAHSAQVRIANVFAPLKPTRVVLTRLDEAVGFGVVLNAMDKLDGSLSYLTAGQNIPHDIEEACSRRVAELILPMDG
ncbi:MAG: AAA family ATPase [Planctomycetota bacterium]